MIAKQTSDQQLDAAIQAACNLIAPTWPLDRMIAVNPYWSWIGRPFHEAAYQMAKLAGSAMTMPLSYYRPLWQQGTISAEALSIALDCMASTGGQLTAAEAIAALDSAGLQPQPAPLLSDCWDRQRDLRHEPAWCDTVTNQISQFCAAYFDADQAHWHPDTRDGLYPSWRRCMQQEHSVALLMKTANLAASVASTATEPREQIRQALCQLELAPEHWAPFLQAVLYRIGGWAAWCAYLQHDAKLAGREDDTLQHLLAIRLSWECLLDDQARQPGSHWHQWQTMWADHLRSDERSVLSAGLVWQHALELSYQSDLSRRLAQAAPAAARSQPRIQAVFCIDVRSERMRRHLEAQSAEVETLGFAGFFGLPIRYTPLGTDIIRPQLPGLFAPALTVCDSTGEVARDQHLAQQRQRRLRSQAGWQPLQRLPASAFGLVETTGLGYIGKLITRAWPILAGTTPTSPGLSRNQARRLRPILMADPEQQIELASQVLKGMGLMSHTAPLVLLVGHGSSSQNNPQRAGLDCGACCGQSGDINARALAALLNDPTVRAGLSSRGITLAASTWFLAALHNTTTDEVMLYDAECVPAALQSPLADLKSMLTAAAMHCRAERAPQLGLSHLGTDPQALARALFRRAEDWAETRPEWGLANNAAFIIAPRARTRDVPLDGRTFLHEYDHHHDQDGSLLTQLMTAAMVIAHWINMQYFASTVDNPRFGSGNKTLHNVVAGRLGVFEGNGGDLRIGLAKQSVHDGTEWFHQPLRLTVVIDAPQAVIASVMAANPVVHSLVSNQWLYLARFEHQAVAFYRDGAWTPGSGTWA